MKFDEFKQLFLSALEIAADNAEKALGKKIPHTYEVILHCTGHSGDVLSVDEAAASLFIDENKFYAVIDVAVQQVSLNATRVFVRCSGHAPVPFEKTWNFSNGNGSFKQLFAQIREVDD
jgi:hypothetical protein